MLQQLLLISLLGSSLATAGLPCTQTFASRQPPSTADTVRPSDVAALHVVGLDEHSTELSSVLSKLSELLAVFVHGLGSSPSQEKELNVVQFPQLGSLVEQAGKVSSYEQSKQDSGLTQDWTLVLLFVRVDQLCACDQQQASTLIRRVVQEVDEALQVLHSEMKQTIVSVALWDGENTMQTEMCSCLRKKSEGKVRLHKALLSQALRESLDELMVQKRWYRDRDDFTVTVQDVPLIRDVSSAALLSESDLSKQNDELMLQLWKNLLQHEVDRGETEASRSIFTPPCPTEDRPFLRTEGNSPSYQNSQTSPHVQEITGTVMPCEDLSPSSSIPSSVHELRPGDIKVVGAVGDSLTAGNGIASSPSDILDVLREYRGLSWSIGGDEDLTTVTTVPNILKLFNHNVIGFSTGVGDETTPQAALNQAVAGEKSRHVPAQLQSLVSRMKSNTQIDFENDWKLITIFIGGNDFCDHCSDTLLYSVENFLTNMRDSLDYLHAEVPRVLVNLVEPLYILPLRELHNDKSLNCPTWLVNMLCPCVVLPESNSEALQTLETLNRGYQNALHGLIESGRYDTRSDFTVVIQPFLRDIFMPRLPDGRPDRSYFSADCFHLSQKANTLLARALWNNMLEPLGSKTSQQDFNSTFDVKCPTKDSPFIRTFSNSDHTYAGAPPNPGPVNANPHISKELNSQPTPVSTTTTPTTDRTVKTMSTSHILPTCSSSIPVLVTVFVGVVSFLAGIAVHWLILGFVQRQKHKEKMNMLEMKGTGF